MKILDEEEMAKDISKNTGIPLDTVLKVLDEEFKYMEKLNLIKRRGK